MPGHRTGSREEWQAAREELARLEAEQARRDEEIRAKRLDLPWVPVDKEYPLDTAEGTKTLAELFDGRSQLLDYVFVCISPMSAAIVKSSLPFVSGAPNTNGCELSLLHR